MENKDNCKNNETHQNNENCQSSELSIAEWMEEEQHQDWVDMMKESAVIPFATSLWA
ncbi:hypothetical protein [Klebsiella sp. BIGb0407]|uniref:hypothetical protein n=1 Tax=Klebsiella sp. BIGb0407 TaxID=2940603 RepID=UPI0021681F8D|nr:hypothetical protein [Klebsiella sp. BIGb0407]MCS3432464.1 hypothetical protein [Klebsiella sp. BIGb0407]